MLTASTEAPRPLTLQLLEWIINRPRSYAQTIDAWRTSCPRLSIWEEACGDGLIECERGGGLVSLSAKGAALLAAHRSASAAGAAR